MARKTFDWFPDAGSTKDVEPLVTVTRYGDGYENRVRNGINHMPQKWSVRFTRATDVGNAIDAFLTARGGFESFFWTNPNRETGIYVCRKWQTNRSQMGLVIVSALFEQVFEAA